jgi:hypothetical protein
MVAFQFYLQSGIGKEIRWVGDDSYVLSLKNFQVKKEV